MWLLLKMNRRNFLKIMSIGTASTAVAIPSIKFVSAKISVPKQKQLGMIRETMRYDVSKDGVIVRHDIFNGKAQWHVDQILPDSSDENLIQAREVAARLLSDILQHNKIRISDLKPLPIISNG